MCVCHIHSLTCSLAHSSYIYLSLSLSFPFLLHLLHLLLLLLFVLLSLSPYSTILFLFLLSSFSFFQIFLLFYPFLSSPDLPPHPTHPETSKAVGFRATTMLTNKRKPGVVDRSLLWAQCIHKENTVEFAEIKGKCIVNSTI